MDSKFTNVITNPLLITHWLSFQFTSLRPVLSAHLDEKTVNEICDETITSEAAAVRLHDQVLQAIDDDLYLAILNYCQDKQEYLSNLLNTMWIDLDDDEEEENNCEITKNQHDILLSKHSELIELFDGFLHRSEISFLLQNHCPHECQTPSGYFLYRKLLKQDNKQFYKEVCKLLRNKHDKYKNCFDFMSKVDEVTVSTRSSLTQIDNQELLSIKTQLAEIRNAVGNLSLEFTSEMCDCKQIVTILQMNVNDENQKLHEKLAMQEKMLNNFKNEFEKFTTNSNKEKQTIIEENKKLRELLKKEQEQINSLRNELETFKEGSNRKMQSIIEENKHLPQKLAVQEEKIVILQNKVQVFIKMIGGRQLSVRVFLSDTVMKLKEIYCNLSGHKVVECCFIFNKRRLDDTDTLQTIGVTEDSTIICTIQRQPGFLVHIRDVKDRTLSFEVALSDSVLSLKEKYHDRTGIPVPNMRFTYAGKILENEKTLADYEMVEDCIITYIQPVKG